MDINLKGSSGFDAAQKICNSLAKTRVIGLTLHDEINVSRQARRLLNASLQGLDDEVRDDIRAALRRLLPDIRLEAWGTLAEEDDSLQLDLLLQRQRF
jgi:DNA-binding NarL/FixJ family response regulator